MSSPLPVPLPTPIDRLDEIAGTYQLTWRDAAGDHRSEPLTLTRYGAYLHISGARQGLAIVWQSRLVLSFAPAGSPATIEKLEIGAYRIEDKSVLGLWVPPNPTASDYSICGVEHSSVEGTMGETWKIHQAIAIDGSTYSGKVTRELLPHAAPNTKPLPVTLTWDLLDGTFHSFGLDFGDAVYSTYCLEPGLEHGLAVYDLRGAHPHTAWVGTSLSSTSPHPRPESLLRP